MDASFLLIQALNGLASASTLFIMASGLTIVFGVTRIVNFAHGSFVMLGAYLAVTLVPLFLDAWPGPVSFFAAVFVSALVVGFAGLIMEVVLLRRLYAAPELFQLLATFGIVLIVQDLAIWLWGPQNILGPRAPGLDGAVRIAGRLFPTYELMLIAAGPIVLGLLWLLFRRTRFGVLVRAATEDRERVAALGVNQALLFTGTLFLGAFLGGLAGALMTPKAPAAAGMDTAVIVQAFVVTVIGGMGSVPGAFLAALLIGELQAFGILVFPRVTLVLVFLVMAAVLIARPSGLLGRAEAEAAPPAGASPPLGAWRPWHSIAAALLLAALACIPAFADGYTLRLGIEVMAFALLAFSLGFLIGQAGLISFGHAAYFGLGAYGAGLVSAHLDAPMELALLAAPLAAGVGAALFGAFVVRLSGVYLAMLTLAFAEIVHVAAVQWVELTGGDNGLLGIWPSDWASGRPAYYYLTLVLTSVTLAALVRVVHAPFGMILRASRDSASRASAMGVDVARHRWLAFTLAGAAAGLAGGIYAFSRGNIDPTVLAIPQSVDALAMVLLGGVTTLAGPVVGAGVLHLLKDYVMPLTEMWRMALGLTIVGLVLVFPNGIAGAFRRLAR